MKKLDLPCLLEELRSDEESGVRSAASEAWRCSVSGISTMRLVPKIKVPSPNVKGIQGDLAMRKDATVGAMNSATIAAVFPSRNTLALKDLRQLYI
jgi:uncharacterized protein YqkB